jgi:hypothetical protein
MTTHLVKANSKHKSTSRITRVALSTPPMLAVGVRTTSWYNFKHHHSGLAGFTPEQVFTGRYHEVAKDKQRALDKRYPKNPERFVMGRPLVTMPPTTVVINPITLNDENDILTDRVNFPTLAAAGYVKSILSLK